MPLRFEINVVTCDPGNERLGANGADPYTTSKSCLEVYMIPLGSRSDQMQISAKQSAAVTISLGYAAVISVRVDL